MTRSGFFVTGYRAHEGEAILSAHDTSDEAVASLPETYSVLLTTYDEYIIYDVRDIDTTRNFRWKCIAYPNNGDLLVEVIK